MVSGCTATNSGKPYLLKEYPISNLYDENSSDNVGIVLFVDHKDKTNLQTFRT
jgi:hypothetical protein